MDELSHSQIDQFQRDGFVVVKNLLDQQTVGMLHRCFDRLFRGKFETGIPPDEVNWQLNKNDPSLTRQICNGWKADKLVASVVLRTGLGKVIACLANWPGTRIFQDNLLWKPAKARPIGYHQDNAYISWLDPQEMVSCWMALDDTKKEGGTLELVRHSHHWANSPGDSTFHGPKHYRKAMETAAKNENVVPEVVHIEIPSGSASFHHGWTWHGSGTNNTNSDRRALVLHGISTAAKFVPHRLHEGNGPIYGRYKCPKTNFLDDKHFPTLWEKSW